MTKLRPGSKAIFTSERRTQARTRTPADTNRQPDTDTLIRQGLFEGSYYGGTVKGLRRRHFRGIPFSSTSSAMAKRVTPPRPTSKANFLIAPKPGDAAANAAASRAEQPPAADTPLSCRHASAATSRPLSLVSTPAPLPSRQPQSHRRSQRRHHQSQAQPDNAPGSSTSATTAAAPRDADEIFRKSAPK